ncbi:hypothetical protein HED60_19230 [Planctomycetales bacterium ZRK34]|nr:hypothetical protein HED60_19230 [Planctomycetales bacterium ZRK34]
MDSPLPLHRSCGVRAGGGHSDRPQVMTPQQVFQGQPQGKRRGVTFAGVFDGDREPFNHHA